MALGIFHAIDRAVLVDPDQLFGEIYEAADETRSLGISIREAAFRRDSAWLRIHRAEFVQQSRLLAALIRDLAPIEGKQ